MERTLLDEYLDRSYMPGEYFVLNLGMTESQRTPLELTLESIAESYKDMGLHFITKGKIYHEIRAMLSAQLNHYLAPYKHMLVKEIELAEEEYWNYKENESSANGVVAGAKEVSPINSLISVDDELMIKNPSEKNKGESTTTAEFSSREHNVDDRIKWLKFLSKYDNYYNILDNAFRTLIYEFVAAV